MKYIIDNITNLYSKIYTHNNEYIINSTYRNNHDSTVVLNIVVWYYQEILWFKFKKIYHNVYINTTKDKIKIDLEKELIILFGREFEKTIITENRKKILSKLLENGTRTNQSGL